MSIDPGGPHASRQSLATFAGRAPELGALVEQLTAIRGDGCRMAVVEGEPGIGKTRLIDEALGRIGDLGARVLRGKCEELERDRPFGMIADCLSLRHDEADPERARIGRLLLGETAGRSDRSDDPRTRFLVLEKILDLVEQLGSEAPLVLVMEDLQWADPSTVLVINRLDRRVASLPVALVATLRPGPRSSDLERVVHGLATRGALHFTLAPLDDSAVAAVARDILRAEPGPMLRQFLGRTGGNPLFVTELLAGLAHDRAVNVVDGEAELDEPKMPPPLKLAILRQLGSLSAECLQTLRIAAVLGSTFAVGDLAASLQKSTSELLSALTEATRAGVLTEDGDHLSFGHDLVREAIYDDLSPAIRKALHQEIGRVLADAGAATTRVATHLSLGASAGDAEAIAWLRRAARDAASQAPAVAVELLQRAADIAGPEDDDVRAELSRAMVWAGQPMRGAALVRDLLPRITDRVLQIELRTCLGTALRFDNRPGESAVEFEAAAHLAGPGTAERMRLMAEASVGRLHDGDLEGAVAIADQVLEFGRRAEDDLLVDLGCTTLAWAAVFTSDAETGLEMAEAAMAASRRSADPRSRRPDAAIVASLILMSADRADEARRLLRSSRAEAERLGLVWDLPIFHHCLGLTSFFTGEWPDARLEFDTGTALAEEVETKWGLVTALGRTAVMAVHQNDLVRARTALEAAEGAVATAGAAGMETPWVTEARALLHRQDGHDADALATLTDLWSLLSATHRVGLHRTVATTLTRWLAEGGDADRARVVAESAEDAARAGTWSLRGAALQCHGLAYADIDAHLASVEAYRRAPRRIERAEACVDAADALRRVDRGGDAIGLLQEAREIFDGADAASDVARVDATLRTLGVRRAGRRSSGRPRHGWDSLSDTERVVVDLVAEGCTNPQIAARLYISRRTVETHVSHALGKLGLKSRVELAREVTRRAAQPSPTPP